MRRFATPEVAHDLQQSGFEPGGRHVQGTVLFSDIRGFTALVESQPPEEMIELLNADRRAAGKAAIRIGVGIATGEMVAGSTPALSSARHTPASAIR
ncbi:MAG: adenylate/guanylate cyclase domain-containing protein [Burkholderiales bacterium]